jgi:hypothetical protein
MRSVLARGQTFPDARDGRVGNCLVQEENEALVRMPMSRKVSTVHLQRVKDDGVALIEKFPIGCCNAIRHFASEFDEWILSQSERVIRVVIIRSPEQNRLWRWIIRFLIHNQWIQLPDSFFALCFGFK